MWLDFYFLLGKSFFTLHTPWIKSKQISPPTGSFLFNFALHERNFLRQLCSCNTWEKCFILTQAKAIPIRKSRACVVEDTCTIHSLQKVISSLSWEKHIFRVFSVICTTKSIRCILRCLKMCELNHTLRIKKRRNMSELRLLPNVMKLT